MNENQAFFSFLDNEKFISLTTYYKSGRGVATPVEFVIRDSKLLVNTRKDSYKVKRIRNENKAEIAPCTMRGKEKDPKKSVYVRILPEGEDEDAKIAFEEKYSGFFYKLVSKLTFWRQQEERVYLEIVPR
ncbi:MAG: PPOX class F420-dependent oxidoreductase [Candidatus Thorarchaeota archaeon]